MDYSSNHQMSLAAKIAVVCIGLLLLLPVGLIPWVDHATRSTFESRTLAPFPHFDLKHLQGRYQTELSSYLKDHAAFAFLATSTVKQAQFYGFKFSNDPMLRVTRDRVPFLLRATDATANHWGAFTRLCDLVVSNERIQSVIARMNSLKAASEASGMPIYYLIAPTKSTIYFDELHPYMPEQYFKECNLTERALALSNTLESTSGGRFKALYPLSAMFQKREDLRFYPKQNYHWRGASVDLAVRSLFDISDPTPTLEVITEHVDISSILGFRLHSERFVAPSSSTFQSYVFGATHGADLDHTFFSEVSSIAGQRWVGGIAQSPKQPTNQYSLLIGDSFANSPFSTISHYRGNVLHLSSNGLSPEVISQVVALVFNKYAISEVIFIYRDLVTDFRGDINFHAEKILVDALMNEASN